MESNQNLIICIIFILMMGISAAENRRKLRPYLSWSRSHIPDDFDTKVFVGRRFKKSPIQPTTTPVAESQFETSRSQQQFTLDASRSIRTWPDTADVSSRKDYSKVSDYQANWERNEASENQRPDTMIEFSAIIRPYISNDNDPAWTRLPSLQSQQERKSILRREIKTWSDSAKADWKFHPNIVCRCDMNLGGIYRMPTRSLSSNKLHTLEDSKWGQSQTHRELEFQSPPHPMRIRHGAVKTDLKGDHHNQVDSRVSTFGTQASRPNKHPTKRSILYKSQTTEAPTWREHGSTDVVIKNLA